MMPQETAPMTTAFLQMLGDQYRYALDLMGNVLGDCPDSLWATDLWPDEAPAGPAWAGSRGLGGSAPWNIAHHALVCLDYDLTGGLGLWEPPPPFDEREYAWPTRLFTRSELLGYVEWCRGRVQQVLDALTEVRAASLLPSTHRYGGTPFGVLIGSIPLHVVEHAAQIRQFLTAAGVETPHRDATDPAG
jgi:hypothetical protein